MNVSAIGKEVIKARPQSKMGLGKFSSIVLGTFLLASSCATNRNDRISKDTFNKENTELVKSEELTESNGKRPLIGEVLFCTGLLAAMGYALHDAKKEDGNKKA